MRENIYCIMVKKSIKKVREQWRKRSKRYYDKNKELIKNKHRKKYRNVYKESKTLDIWFDI
jgi:hypothetical protein